MSAREDHEDLDRLVDRLSAEHLRRLRALVDADPELHDLLADGTPADEGVRPLRALDGLWDGPTDVAEHHDELIRERLARAT